jgi:hypothetical protein
MLQLGRHVWQVFRATPFYFQSFVEHTALSKTISLVWHTPDEPQEFQRCCLNAYLRHHAPPGGQERVWPQRISLEAPAAAARVRYGGA